MNSLIVAVISYFGFILAYRFYGRFLSRKIFRLDDSHRVPSIEHEDGVDFVPTSKRILFGHHFTSIAGAGPIVGPAIAVIWGWLPALIWIFLGSIFMGAVHDFGSLIISMRFQGNSIGSVAKDVIHPVVRMLFLITVFFLLVIVVAVFMLIIGLLFTMFPASVFPVWCQIPIALVFGYIIYEKKGNVTIWGLVSLVLMFATIFFSAGNSYWSNFHITPVLGSELLTWLILLIVYCYIASVIPVQRLLQPRDYINSNMLLLAMGLLFLGLVILRPVIAAPAINHDLKDAPSIIPFLFITVACGAISGFHSMVASGTTVKQASKESDTLFIGYGSMLIEGALAVMVLLACTAGLGGTEAWTERYSSWTAASGLGAKIGAFIEGSATFLEAIKLPRPVGEAMIAVMVVSFAATTLDTSTRILRYVTVELADAWKLKPLQNRFSATTLGLAAALALSILPPMIKSGKVDGSGGMLLWPLFGTGNQLLAGLALLVITVWLARQGIRTIYTLIPLVFVLIMTGWAMFVNFGIFLKGGNYHLMVIGGIILILEIVMIAYAVKVALELKKRRNR